MSLTMWRRCRARVIILSALVSSCADGRCFFAAKGTTDLHTGVGVWVGGGACVCVCDPIAIHHNWRSVEDTKLSTNKQHSLSLCVGGRGILGACREELQQ
jgi:hypothetical protein